MSTSCIEISWTDGDKFVFSFFDAEERVQRLAKALKLSTDDSIESIKLFHEKRMTIEVDLDL